MKKPPAKKRIHQRSQAKKRLFIEGFALLRHLAEGPLSRGDAESELRIPYREWYRWLRVFKDCGIPLAIDYRRRRGTTDEKTIRLWPEDWARLIKPATAPRKRPAKPKPPTKAEITRAITKAISRILK